MIDEGKASIKLISLNRHQLPYAKLRLNESYGASVIASIQNEKIDGIQNNLQEYCRQIYELELDYNAGDEYATNLFFFKVLGTSSTASVFFENVDNGWFFRKKKLCLRSAPNARSRRVVDDTGTVALGCRLAFGGTER